MPSPFVELEVGERVVKVTNPDKVLFPARQETKMDLVQYYLAVGGGIVRAVAVAIPCVSIMAIRHCGVHAEIVSSHLCTSTCAAVSMTSDLWLHNNAL